MALSLGFVLGISAWKRQRIRCFRVLTMNIGKGLPETFGRQIRQLSQTFFHFFQRFELLTKGIHCECQRLFTSNRPKYPVNQAFP